MKLQKVRQYGLFLLLGLATLLLPVAAFAAGAGYYTVSQGEKMVQVVPIENAKTAVDFYNLTENHSTTGLEKANTAVFFLHRNATTGELSLFVLLSATGGTAGTTTISLAGVPAGAGFLVQDDGPADFRESWSLTPPTGSVTWAWDAGKSDGMALGPLGAEFSMTLYPQFTSGITSAEFLSGGGASPTTVSLNLTDPIVVKASSNLPPVATFTVTPASPHVDEPVSFDASASNDPDGSVTKFEWDFDGDGVFDRTTTTPTTTYTYASSGAKKVTLRVTDNQGATSTSTVTVNVAALSVKVNRTISTIAALPGSTFLVTVRIESETDLAGVGLQENLPVGWKIKPIENAGAAFKRATVQWVFIDEIKAGTTKIISYEVTVPSSDALLSTSLPVCFSITGTFQSRTPALELPVQGDSKVQIDDALPLKTAIAHLVPRTSPDGQDTIDLRLSQKIDPNQLTRAIQMWQNEESVPWTQGALITLEAMKELSAYAYTCTPVDMALPSVPTAKITAVRTIATPVPCGNVLLNYYGPDGTAQGNKFTVKVEISADQDLYGVGLAEELPTGWTVTPIENGGFTYKAAKTQWLYPTKLPAGTMATIIYQVEVPQSASIETSGSDPCYVSGNDISGVVDAALPCMDTVVTGDSSVAVSDCVSVLVAISRWDVTNDRLDLTLSNKISFQQVQRAVAFWLEDETVPRTCGQTVTYETLKTIIAYWLTNTDICDPLPGSVAPACSPEVLPCQPTTK